MRSDSRLGGKTRRTLVHSAYRPGRNGYVESFNSRIRDECLHINIFWSPQARIVITGWKEDDNQRRQQRPRLRGPSGLCGSLHPAMKID
ncbi:transposase [Nostocoides sp. HKS02]|nr:transposase [Tetrasphaera sp. HKS02]